MGAAATKRHRHKPPAAHHADMSEDHDDVDDGGGATVDDVDDAVAAFLRKADAVYEEYDRGYLDPDAALARLEPHVGDLREAYGED